MNTQKDTIIRTVVLAVALVNQVLSAMGKSVLPIEEEQVEALVSVCLTIASSVWAWWKNNSFTEKAKLADLYLQAMKERD